MASLATLTINDGQATPVAHNFDPTGPDRNGVITYEDRSGGVPLGYPTITLHKQSPRGQSTVYRVKGAVNVPVLETATGTDPNGYVPGPAVAYVNRANVEFILPRRSANAERKDLRAYLVNLVSDAVAQAMVEDLEGVW